MLILTIGLGLAGTTERDVQKESCNRGEAKACTELAIRYQNGQGAPQDAVYAMELFRKGCSMGDQAACVHRADAYFTGNGVARNPKRAVDLYERACQEKTLGRACRALAELYIIGDEGIDADRMMSAMFFGQGCALGDGESCIGEALGIERGEFLEPDAGYARRQLRRACELNHGRGCTLIGERLMRGDGGDKDVGGAATFFQKGCTLQEAESCRHLGVLALKGKGTAKDPELARRVFTDACAWNDYQACNELADMLKKHDLEAATKAAMRSCDLGHEAGCKKAKQLEWKLGLQRAREGG